MSRSLPPEVWERIAINRDMRLDDLEALAMTCHNLREVIMSSRGIWRAVVEDLLAESPNALLARTMNAESASSLRKKVMRFNQVRNTLCKRALRASTWDAKDDYAAPPVVLPGTDYAIGPLPERKCVLHFLELRTGSISEAWRVTGNLIRYAGDEGIADFTLHKSSHHGVTVAVAYVTESQNVIPTHEYTIHILQVLGEDVPRLHTLSIIEVKIVPRHILVVDDTLMVVDTSLALLESFQISSSGAAPLPAKRWSLPINPRLDHGFYAITPDILVALSKDSRPNGAKLRVIHLLDVIDSSDSQTLATRVLHTISLPRCDDVLSDIDFLPRHSRNNTWHVELRCGDHIFGLSVAHDHTTSKLVRISGPRNGLDSDIAGWGAQYVYQFPDESCTLLQLDPRPSAAALEKRLSRRTPVRFSIPLEIDADAYSPGLSFDEWTGVGIVPWTTPEEMGRFAGLTAIVV